MSDLLITNFTMGNLPNVTMNRQEFANAIAALLQGHITGAFLPGQEGGTQPTTDVGPWHPAGANYFEFWNAVAGTYQANYPLPTGSIVMWSGPNTPDGFLMCMGQQVSQSDYPALFTVIGYNFSLPDTADGPTTTSADAMSLTAASQFRLPDFRGRYPIGAGSGTPNQAGGSNTLTPRTLGHRIGQESVTIKRTDLPDIGVPVFDYAAGTTQTSVAVYGGYNYQGDARSYTIARNASPTDATNVPPTNVVNYIIRT